MTFDEVIRKYISGMDNGLPFDVLLMANKINYIETPLTHLMHDLIWHTYQFSDGFILGILTESNNFDWNKTVLYYSMEKRT